MLGWGIIKYTISPTLQLLAILGTAGVIKTVSIEYILLIINAIYLSQSTQVAGGSV